MSQDTGLIKIATVSVVSAVIFISLFGIQTSMLFAYSDAMVGCPLMGESVSMCQMGVLEHIAYWQQLFTAKVNDANSLILGLLTILFVLAFPPLSIRNKDNTPFDLSFYLYTKSKPQTRLFNYLNLLFSRGILQPKIY